MSKSYLDLINECDKFPYPQDDPAYYQQCIAKYHKFKISGCNAVLGYIPNKVVTKFPWPQECWSIDKAAQIVTLVTPPDATTATRSELLAHSLSIARKADVFDILRGWRDELYPIYGPGKELLASIERSGSALFGVVTYGVHMTAYVKDAKHGLQIWVPRRSRTKQTWPGMLDNTVAGGTSTGEVPFECLVREAMEEASLPEDVVRRHAKTVGCLTYVYVRDARAGGETGLLQPECEYIYDLELNPTVIPKPCDTEVEDFRLWTLDDVKVAMAKGEFKPNCAIVLIDFFVRHGIITPENEKDYLEIQARMHRRLELPTK
ncbi:hypothetical protein AJ80_03898 [Polytolypa hystricis UAMH7299]|uniref:Nudix hydrolase domain-containing protein n=1 Tax=Polytolypa hystricis (strain UAMH7299) TaxID=1447883 RepID=A0A2B7YFA4_POLH7|nr:hypothetical protein AJ80_03898 [Polytolypa hystricis UAMH7299]